MPDRLVFNGLPMSGTTAQRPTNAESGQPYFDRTTRSQQVFNRDTNSWQPVAGIVAAEVTFTETTGAGTYTGDVDLPAGATVLDVIVHGTALWTAATSAILNVGDFTAAGAEIDADGIYANVNLRATDLLAGESLSFAQSGGRAGVYNAGTNTHWTNRYSATARKIRGSVVTVGASGNAGRTRMVVIYALPAATAATKA